MLDMSELIHDPDFCTNYTILRKWSLGDWSEGKPKTQDEVLHVEGPVFPTTSQDVKMMPEGDRRTGMMTFISDTKIMVTSTEATSDICVYEGEKYKILAVFSYGKSGFWKAIGTSIGEDDGIC